LLVLTGETISADEACKIGLIDFLTNQANINNDILELVGKLREGGKVAQQTSKNLFRELGSSLFREELKEKTSSITAGARVNAEGSEGIRAFLKKRLPNWKR
jgi:enoyl-CoA hydratase/carnithine racemase